MKKRKKRNVAVFVVCLNCFSVLIRKSFSSVLFIYFLFFIFYSGRVLGKSQGRRTGTRGVFCICVCVYIFMYNLFICLEKILIQTEINFVKKTRFGGGRFCLYRSAYDTYSHTNIRL